MKMMSKINRKAGDYRLTATAHTKSYCFIIDGSLETNKNGTATKWYISNLKWALKKFILEEDIINAVLKASNYVNKKFKNYFSDGIPYISLGIYKIEDEKLKILLVNNAKCYLFTDKVQLIENEKIEKLKTKIIKEIKSKGNNFKANKDIYLKKIDFKNMYYHLEDKTNYIYGEVPYEEAFSILLCNEGFQNYQKYLELQNSDFYTLVKQQGVKYCYSHLNRIEEKDVTLDKLPRFKEIDDVVAIYNIFV